MNERTGWSPTEKVLYVAGIPVLVLLAVLLFLGVAQSEKNHAAAAPAAAVSMSPQAVAERARHKAFQEARDEYMACLKGMGVHIGGVRTRFSRMPDMNKIRTATGVCQTVLRNQGRPAPPQQHAATPNSL